MSSLLLLAMPGAPSSFLLLLVRHLLLVAMHLLLVLMAHGQLQASHASTPHLSPPRNIRRMSADCWLLLCAFFSGEEGRCTQRGGFHQIHLPPLSQWLEPGSMMDLLPSATGNGMDRTSRRLKHRTRSTRSTRSTRDADSADHAAESHGVASQCTKTSGNSGGSLRPFRPFRPSQSSSPSNGTAV